MELGCISSSRRTGEEVSTGWKSLILTSALLPTSCEYKDSSNKYQQMSTVEVDVQPSIHWGRALGANVKFREKLVHSISTSLFRYVALRSYDPPTLLPHPTACGWYSIVLSINVIFYNPTSLCLAQGSQASFRASSRGTSMTYLFSINFLLKLKWKPFL